jgi:hypothetical protein
MKKSLDESELLFENWMPNMDELKEAVIRYKIIRQKDLVN